MQDVECTIENAGSRIAKRGGHGLHIQPTKIRGKRLKAIQKIYIESNPTRFVTTFHPSFRDLAKIVRLAITKVSGSKQRVLRTTECNSSFRA